MVTATIAFVSPGPSAALTDGQEDGGECVQHVHQPHEHGAHRALDKTGPGADEGAHQRRHECREEAGDQRHPAAVEQPGEHVPAHLVGPQWVAGGEQAPEPVNRLTNQRILGGEQWS